MARREFYQMEQIRKEWTKLMGDPGYRMLPRHKRAAMICTTKGTLERWEAEADEKAWAIWDRQCEEKVGREAPAVYEAILKKAIAGDTKAAELFLQKFKGWSVKQISEVTNINKEIEEKSTDELTLEVLRGLSKEQLEWAMKEKEIRVVSGEAGAVGEGEGGIVKQGGT